MDSGKASGAGAYWGALAILLAAVAPSRAQCPETGNCPDQIIATNPAAAYQQSPHARVRSVLLYDYAPAHNAGRQALRRSLSRLSQRHGFRLHMSYSPTGWIQDSILQGVDVVVFSQNEADPLVTQASTAAMERFIYQQGRGMLLVHGAAAFISCPGVGTGSVAGIGGDSLGHPDCRFMARAAARQYYHQQPSGSLMTAYVDSVGAGQVPPHRTCTGGSGANCTGTAAHAVAPPASAIHHGVRNAETRNIFTGLARVWPGMSDEWYEFVSSPRLVGETPRRIPNLDSAWYLEGSVNVLLSLDETSRYLGSQRMGDHPVAWTRKMGYGLAAVNTMGHADTYAQNDSALERFNWGLIRYLARDFVGCMDPAYLEYNPEASVTVLSPGLDDPEPCKTLVGTAVRPAVSGSRRFSVKAHRGALEVAFAGPGAHRVRVRDLKGSLLRAVEALDSEVRIEGLHAGLYLLEVSAPDGAKTVRRALIP